MIFAHIEGLVQKALNVELIQPEDTIYVRNRVLALLKLDSFPDEINNFTDDSIPNLLQFIIQYAVENHIIEDLYDEQDIFSATIMDCFVVSPSVINETFQKKYQISPQYATDYFYKLSQNSNYIQTKQIQKNIHFKAETIYGEMDITINLSKPEKDPEQIKREKYLKRDINYPKCVLCIENEGYAGRTGYPARANHRIVKVPIEDEIWYLQYSPYVYYNEHSILLSEEHRDMKINKNTFQRLLIFIKQFPHYFIGSNADLPIVGGSILSHDHYQAGKYIFPMTNARQLFQFRLEDFPNITASALDWPLATIRLQSANRKNLVEAANHLLKTWQNYSDDKANIIAFTDGVPHNTVTPIARMRDNRYELDLVLRNNRTTTEHPLGIFHPHEDVHHIKKENIGLIEVMGLAVLPARLKNELEEISLFLQNKPCNIASYHLDWATSLRAQYGYIESEKEANLIIQRELGRKFAKALGDAGVFKNIDDWNHFLATLSVQAGV